MNEVREIAKITSAFLGWEDHGIFTCVLMVDYGHSGQGIGQYALDGYDDESGRRIGTAFGTEFLMRLMRACGVQDWNKLVGRTVYVVKESDGWNAKVLGIEPLPTEPGERFMFDELRDEVAA
jgi:hypothetical protein